MIRVVRAVMTTVLLSGLAPTMVQAQVSVLDQFDPLSRTTGGVHLYGITVSSLYSSGANGNGPGVSLLNTPGAVNSNAPAMQGSATFGWMKEGHDSNISVVYSPSYVRGFGNLNYHSWNHSLGLSASRKLNSKWALSGSLHGIMSDFNQLLFARGLYGSLTGVPATFNDLAGGVLTGSSQNPDLQALLGGQPLNGPETSFLYGGRELSITSDVSIAYAMSTRSSLHLSLDANRTQFLNSGNRAASGTAGYLVAETTGLGGNVGWSYLLTPRTTLSATVSSARTMARYQDAYGTQVNLSIGRTLSRRLFVQGMGGVGFITPVRELLAHPQHAQSVWGATVGYKLETHTFLAGYTRSVSDVYGLGADATDNSNAGWTWSRPGGRTKVSGAFGYSRLLGHVFLNSASWTVNAGAARALDAHTSLGLSAVYATYPSSVVLLARNLAQRSVMMTLSWSPSERR